MSITIDPCELDRAINVFTKNAQFGFGNPLSMLKSLRGEFTEEPGLRELGRQHALVINGGVGSAAHTLKELRHLVRWLGENTAAMRRAFVGQDDASAAAFCGQRSVEPAAFSFPPAPAGAFDPFDFIAPAHGDSDDPEAVLALLDAGDDGHIHELADYWHNLASTLNEMVGELGRARACIEANSGQAAVGAAECCLAVMRTADVFAENATAMHASVAQLPHIRTSARRVVESIHRDQVAALAAASSPGDKQRIRDSARAETRDFMHGAYQQMLDAAMPPLRNLAVKPVVGPGGGSADVGAAQTVATPQVSASPVAPMGTTTGSPTHHVVGGATPGGGVGGWSGGSTPGAAPVTGSGSPTPVVGSGVTPAGTSVSPGGVPVARGRPSVTTPSATGDAVVEGGFTPRTVPPGQVGQVGQVRPGFSHTGGDRGGIVVHRVAPGPAPGMSGHRLSSVSHTPGGVGAGDTPGRVPHTTGGGGGGVEPISGRGTGGWSAERGASGGVGRPGHAPGGEHTPGGSSGSYGRAGVGSSVVDGGHGGVRGAGMGPAGVGSSGGQRGRGQRDRERTGSHQPITSRCEAEYNLHQLRGDMGPLTPPVIDKSIREPK